MTVLRMTQGWKLTLVTAAILGWAGCGRLKGADYDGGAGGGAGLAGSGGRAGDDGGAGDTGGAGGAAGGGGTMATDAGTAGAAGTDAGADAAATDGGAGADGSSATDGADGGPAVLAAPTAVGLAVVDSDYTSTSISIVSGAGALVKDDCINSGTQASGKLALTVSGDVTLPSQPQRGNQLWLVDRGNAALTVLDPVTCAVSNQISVGTGFISNPHDVVALSDTKAYVTRYNKNKLPPNANATGDDVLIVDLAAGSVTGRIDLSTYAASVTGKDIQARPDRAVIAAGKVFVSLGSQDDMFDAAGAGRLVVIDPATDAVTSTVELTGLKGCSGMSYVDAAKTIFVACDGTFSEANPLALSGVALVDVSVTPPVVHVVAASTFGANPVNSFWIAPLSSQLAFAGTYGMFADATHDVAAVPDAVFSFNPMGGAPTSRLTADAFDLGRGAAGGTAFFASDATPTKPRIHVFAATGTAAPTETTAFDPDPARGLPPREIAWY